MKEYRGNADQKQIRRMLGREEQDDPDFLEFLIQALRQETLSPDALGTPKPGPSEAELMRDRQMRQTAEHDLDYLLK